MTNDLRTWHIVQTVELHAKRNEVWNIIGGFFTIHKWHPDIVKTDLYSNQNEMFAVRRRLTFPGQPETVEELTFFDPMDCHYRYKWHSGKWGEEVQNYQAAIRLFEAKDSGTIFQWSSTFDYFEDAISEFYWNGFRNLQRILSA